MVCFGIGSWESEKSKSDIHRQKIAHLMMSPCNMYVVCIGRWEERSLMAQVPQRCRTVRLTQPGTPHQAFPNWCSLSLEGSFLRSQS